MTAHSQPFGVPQESDEVLAAAKREVEREITSRVERFHAAYAAGEPVPVFIHGQPGQQKDHSKFPYDLVDAAVWAEHLGLPRAAKRYLRAARRHLRVMERNGKHNGRDLALFKDDVVELLSSGETRRRRATRTKPFDAAPSLLAQLLDDRLRDSCTKLDVDGARAAVGALLHSTSKPNVIRELNKLLYDPTLIMTYVRLRAAAELVPGVFGRDVNPDMQALGRWSRYAVDHPHALSDIGKAVTGTADEVDAARWNSAVVQRQSRYRDRFDYEGCVTAFDKASRGLRFAAHAVVSANRDQTAVEIELPKGPEAEVDAVAEQYRKLLGDWESIEPPTSFPTHWRVCRRTTDASGLEVTIRVRQSLGIRDSGSVSLASKELTPSSVVRRGVESLFGFDTDCDHPAVDARDRYGYRRIACTSCGVTLANDRLYRLALDEKDSEEERAKQASDWKSTYLADGILSGLPGGDDGMTGIMNEVERHAQRVYTHQPPERKEPARTRRKPLPRTLREAIGRR